MSKHTPGPWLLATSNSWRRFMSRDGALVCEPIKQNDGHPDLRVSTADARLIAAAPDLLGACNEALEFAEDQEDVVDGDYGQPKPNRAMQVATMLRAAIAKAEGKQ
jgi:hypothetical protein